MKPPSILTLAELEDRLSEPSPGVISVLGKLSGDMLVLGAGGKMGPSLARMAKRAWDINAECKSAEFPTPNWPLPTQRVIAVSRFSDPRVAEELNGQGIETIQGDLLDERAVEALPRAENVVLMAGMKFGSTGREGLTWAMNAYVPALVCRKYAGSRIVAFSTGNVYGLVPVDSGGSIETDELRPTGEYAMSCVGRERIFEYFHGDDINAECRMQNAECKSAEFPTPNWPLRTERSAATSGGVAIIRLNYACELRYGVLVDLAQKVWSGAPVDLSMGYVNTIWQGDANAMALQAFQHVSSPPLVLNVTGPESLSVREICREFGRLFGKEPRLEGTESPTALLSNAGKAFELFGRPQVSAAQMMEWIAAWISEGKPTHNKPTHFESREGKF